MWQWWEENVKKEEAVERKREKKGYRDRKRGRSRRALSPPLSYPQMNLLCCLIMFLSFFLLEAVRLTSCIQPQHIWLVDILADRPRFAARQQEVSLLMQEAAAVSYWHTPLCTLARILFVYRLTWYACTASLKGHTPLVCLRICMFACAFVFMACSCVALVNAVTCGRVATRQARHLSYQKHLKPW